MSDTPAENTPAGTLQFCTVEDIGHLRIVTINRPDVMNALNSQASHELAAVWDEFEAREDLWVGIVTGAGERAFSAGNDLKSQAAGKRGPPPKSGFAGLNFRFDRTKPVIAAVNGVAMGGGFELALACDIVVASENAVFALPEVKVGLIAGGGGVHRLPRLIPHQAAMGILLTGRRLGAREGLALGFINEVVPAGGALEAARRWADQILDASPLAVKATLEAARLGLDQPTLEQAVRTVYPAQRRNAESQDFREGPRAFAEKRKPNWQNR